MDERASQRTEGCGRIEEMRSCFKSEILKSASDETLDHFYGQMESRMGSVEKL
jgi:hypothetical protein